MTQNGSDPPPPPKMPSRLLTLVDPTRKDAGVGVIGLIIKYDPLNHDVQVQGPKGLDIVGLLGILRLAEIAIIDGVRKKSS